MNAWQPPHRAAGRADATEHGAVVHAHGDGYGVPAGFLAEGTYTIGVTTKDRQLLTRSREQRSAPSRAIVDSYLADRDRMAYTLTSWSTLAEFGGPDAYYVYRLAQAASLREFDTQKLLWWDNIFTPAYGRPLGHGGEDRSSLGRRSRLTVGM